MSSTTARHRKPPRRLGASRPEPARARHRKPSAASSVLGARPGRIGVAAGASLTVAAAAVTVLNLPGQAPHAPGQVGTAASGTAAASGELWHSSGAADGALATSELPGPADRVGYAPRHARSAARVKHRPRAAAKRPAPPVYRDPLRSVAGLIPERIDMGADFGGTGPIYAIGNAVITNATGTSAGWPGGGWITYQLTDGPAAGLQVYVAEDVKPTVSVGQHVTSGTVIANMFSGGDGIETGWAMPSGFSAESQLPAAGSVSGGGPFPTDVGVNFDELLQALGVPAAPNFGQAGYGVLPPNYPANWKSATKPA